MKLQNICFAGLMAIVSIVYAKIINRPKFSDYHLPWACSVVYQDGRLIGSGTIFDEDKVIVSVENFNNEVEVNRVMKKYWQVVSSVLVYAGSNMMDPEKLKPWATPKYQVLRATALHVPTGRKDGKWQFKSTPDIKDLSSDSVEYDHYGVAFNVGFLVLEGPFKLNDFVQPIPVLKDVSLKTDRYVSRHEKKLIPSDTCVTYSWANVTNKIVYHEVTYLAKNNCLDVFCMWNLSTCDRFPKRNYHTCFKSVTYRDVCPSARGAALYCPALENSIFGILTLAPSCGLRDMPGVYTTLPWVITLYEAIFKQRFDVDKRPKYDPLKLPQPYSPFG